MEAWDARAASVSEGTGGCEAADLPEVIIMFLEWSDRADVIIRFQRFFDEHGPAFVIADGDPDDEEHSLEAYGIFRSYESFFENETKRFLEDGKIDEDDFAEACAKVRAHHEKRKQSERQPGEQGGLLLRFALSSLSFTHFRRTILQYNKESEKAAEEAEDMGLL